MVLRHLVRRPVRTLLTAVGVGAGVMAIVAFQTVVRGLWRSVDTTIHIGEADLLVFQANVAADLLSVLDEQETTERLLAVPGVTEAVPALWHLLPVEQLPFCLVIGSPIEHLQFAPEDLESGENIRREDEIVVGRVALRLLGKDVGDELEIGGEVHRIAGAFQTGNVFFDGAIMLALPRLQELASKRGQATAFQVYVDPVEGAAAVTERIEEAWPDLVAIGDASEYSKVDQGLEVAQATVWSISVIAIVIGAIIVMNTMWMSVLERTREIGVLRAIGWSRRWIVALVVLEAWGVGLLAWVLGSSGGAVLAALAARLPVATQFVDPAYEAGPFVLALAVAVVLSVIGALLPAWRAAHISPAEALRYE